MATSIPFSEILGWFIHFPAQKRARPRKNPQQKSTKNRSAGDLHDVGRQAEAGPVEAHVEVAVAVEVVRTWHPGDAGIDGNFPKDGGKNGGNMMELSGFQWIFFSDLNGFKLIW